jgi:hypothetical protein
MNDPSRPKTKGQREYKAEVLRKYPPHLPLPKHFFKGAGDFKTRAPSTDHVEEKRTKERGFKQRSSPSLEDSEWDFSKLEESEIATCRHYEMGREVVIQERFYSRQFKANPLVDSEWLGNRVEMIRCAWQITNFISSVRENPAWLSRPASRVLVLYPEWPDTPYLNISREQRLRRLEEISVSVGDEDRLANMADLLEPSNLSFGEKRMMTIGIPLSVTHEDLEKAFAAWLDIHFPRQGKSGTKKLGKTEYSRPQGRGSEKSAAADDLIALAVFRLCKRAGIQRKHVIEKIKQLKGSKNPGACVYGAEKALDRPLKRIWPKMEKFREDTIGDLEPLEPLNLSQPDFTSL